MKQLNIKTATSSDQEAIIHANRPKSVGSQQKINE
jgi:hypothetical protein